MFIIIFAMFDVVNIIKIFLSFFALNFRIKGTKDGVVNRNYNSAWEGLPLSQMAIDMNKNDTQ